MTAVLNTCVGGVGLKQVLIARNLTLNSYAVTLYSDAVTNYKYIFSPHRGHLTITKTCLYNFDPLKPHFYIVKLGFTGVYIIFLFSAQNIHLGTR